MSDAAVTNASFRRLASTLIGGAILGKGLGFVREMLMAQALGISLVADSLRGAMTAVLLPFALFQADTVPAVLLPLCRQWRAEGRSPQLFAALTSVLVLIAAAMMAVLELLAGPWVRVVVGGFSPEALALTTSFTKVMLLASPGSVLFACLTSVELSQGRARLTSVRASVQNVGVMLGIAIMGMTGQAIAIAWCFTLSFWLTSSWGLCMLLREGELSFSSIRVAHVRESTAAFLRRMRPQVIQPLADQQQTWIERLLASGSLPGTVAALDYARTLTESALFIVSQPLGLAVLARAGDNGAAARHRVTAIARPLLILAMPASAFLLAFAPDLVRLVFARGAFGGEGVLLTSRALSGIAVGLWAATLGWILVRQLNSEGRNGRAAWVFVQSYAVGVAFNLLCSRHLGALGFGLGEAARGIALLIGAAHAVGCLRAVFHLVARVLPACAALLLAGYAIHACTDAVLLRLALGAASYAVVVAATGLAMMPAECRAAAGQADRLFRNINRLLPNKGF